MRRRVFLIGVGALVTAPLAAEAQEAARVFRLGILTNVSPTPLGVGTRLVSPLRELGYVEGQNIIIDYRWTSEAPHRLAQLATELVRAKVDVIMAIGPPAIRAAKDATAVIPIVMLTSGDPVRLGFVPSLSRPGGNVTGVSFLSENLSGKLLELLKESMPAVSRVAVLWNPANDAHRGYLEEVQAAGRSLRVTLKPVEVRSSEALEHAFARVAKEGGDGLLLLLDPLFTANLRAIAAFAARNRLPVIYGVRELVDAGGLMAYGPSLVDVNRRAVSYVDKIFKGARPGDLPVEQPTKFELVINLKTAKTLGLTIPPSLLLRADQVIE